MSRKKGAFTLVELLVVIGIVSVLLGLLLPALAVAREASRATVCASNIRQLVIASFAYAAQNRGYWPPAHYGFNTTNLHRWHGTRPTTSAPFDFEESVLKSFLQTPRIKQCPSFEPVKIGFEASAGGYGYNNYYLGSSIVDEMGALHSDDHPAKMTMIRDAPNKIAFAETAMGDPALIEYSFVEPPVYISQWGNFDNSPSIHFRHHGRANIAWAEGHVTLEAMTWTRDTPNAYGADNRTLHLGWFGPADNTLFQRD